MDGTLIRSGNRLHKESMDAALRQLFGFAADVTALRPAGRTDRWLVSESLRQRFPDRIISRSEEDNVLDLMVRNYAAKLEDLRPFVLPGVRDLLTGLRARGYLLGLLTGNVEAIALAKMERAGLAEFFQFGGYGYEFEDRADVVRSALTQLASISGSESSIAVVVGDTPLDVEAAKVHGLAAIAVATGVFDFEDLQASKPDLAVRNLCDTDSLLDWIEHSCSGCAEVKVTAGPLPTEERY